LLDSSGSTGVAAASERVVVVGLAWGSRSRADAESSLAELAFLVESAGGVIVARILQERRRPDAATLIGEGKVEEVSGEAEAHAADLVVLDEDLTPAQQRNLERTLSRRVIDRTQLILDIFARRARTREGRLQVELAQLEYLLPRLAGHGIELSRLGGGIGTRGPGETQLETDRRRIRQRIQSMRREIEGVRRHRRMHREGRQRRAVPVVALVGYTSAGKSTLFNALTAARSAVAPQLFVTLDPLLRRCDLGVGCTTLLADTVGFIRKLPHSLVAAFRATLEEVAEADLLLHVSDASASDASRREAAVHAVLEEIGALHQPEILALNQIDKLSADRRAALATAHPSAVLVSARTGEGLDALRARLVERLDLGPRRVRLRFGRGDERGVARVYRHGRVVTHEIGEQVVEVVADVPGRLVSRFKENLV
jgi:GTP-binding protein HflX